MGGTAPQGVQTSKEDLEHLHKMTFRCPPAQKNTAKPSDLSLCTCDRDSADLSLTLALDLQLGEVRPGEQTLDVLTSGQCLPKESKSTLPRRTASVSVPSERVVKDPA